MDFAERLRQEQVEKINDYTMNFAENIEPEIIKSAQEGYSGYSISLEGRGDSHIIKDKMFLEGLEVLLDGCTVEVQSIEYTNIIFKNKYHKHKLIISWR